MMKDSRTGDALPRGRGGARPGAGRPAKGGVRVYAVIAREDVPLIARARARSGLSTGELLTLIAKEIDNA